jgi:peptidyl-prolyl cis-trans isomerase SurA
VIYSSASSALISSLKQSVEKGDTTAVEKAIASKSARQEIGTFQRNDRPVLAKIEWREGLYAEENNGTQYLVHVKSIVPPGALSFEEARTSVISDYQDYLEKNWIEQLRKKYPVKVNAKVKNYVLEKLKP